MSTEFLIPALKYAVLLACAACWTYAAYQGRVFEGQLRTTDPRAIEALNHPSMLFSRNVSARANEARRKTFIALAMFAVLGLCLVVILYFDQSGPVKSPFLFHDKLG